jgi:hypothetical protein
VRLIAILLLLPSLCFAGDWTREDSYRQTALTALLIIDWGQTRYIVKHPIDPKRPDGTYNWRKEGYNPILREQPSIGRVNNYHAAVIVGHAAIGMILPPDWRKSWQYVWIGIEADTVYRNHHIGIKVNF